MSAAERRKDDRRELDRADKALRSSAIQAACVLGVKPVRLLPYGQYVAVYVGDQPLMTFATMAAAQEFLIP